jgi:hypothetical protein
MASWSPSTWPTMTTGTARTGRHQNYRERILRLGCVPIVAGLIAFATAAYDAYAVNSRAKAEFFGTTIGAQIGWGLWMVLIASLALVVTSTVVVRQIPKLPRT